jgi:hypothetical protein
LLRKTACRLTTDVVKTFFESARFAVKMAVRTFSRSASGFLFLIVILKEFMCIVQADRVGLMCQVGKAKRSEKMKISIDQFRYNGRSEYGNRFLFLLPFVNICHYGGYTYVSTGWLTINLVLTADWRK